MNIKNVLLKQHSLYPKMQIQDMIKLIYQNEFAGGHLIKNEEDSLLKLKEECRILERHSLRMNTSNDVFEEIGNALCRFHLRALQNNSINVTTINRFFLSTANSISGSIKSFEEKLDVFRQCCKDRELPYRLEDLEAYLSIQISRLSASQS